MAVLCLVCRDPDRIFDLQGTLTRKRFQMMQELMPQHPPHLCLQSFFIQMSVRTHEGTIIKDHEPAQMRIPVILSQNQEIIRKALTELNYHENKVARILAKGKTEFVGIIVPNLFLHYFSELLNQILITHDEFGFK